MNPNAPSVSVFDAFSRALERTKQVLFRPFDLGRWFVIGFAAWLAGLGEGGGGGGGGHWSGGRNDGNLREQLERGVDEVRDNLHWIVPLVLGIVVVAVIVGLIILWLSSRGRFLFLHNVATNRAEIALPWHRFRSHGNSLFFLRIVLALAGFALIVPPVVGVIWLVGRMILNEEAGPGPIVASTALFLFALGAGVVVFLVEKLTKDFVVPIMRLRTASVTAAWSEFLRLLSAHPGHFTLYLLFHLVLSIGLGLLIAVVVIATCCLAGCLMAIPYFGTVLVLPVPVFLRAFSASYLAQFGPEYDVFRADPAEGLPTQPV